MERITAFRSLTLPALEANGTNMNCWRAQGWRCSSPRCSATVFFHADMHPGNILSAYEHPENPYIGIDCGIVGTLNREDKRLIGREFSRLLQPRLPP